MKAHLPALTLGPLPLLDWKQWKDTAETLQLYTQIVGKTRLALTPMQDHWWNAPLYVTARGLHTSAMPLPGGHLLDIEFDFIAHQLIFRSSTGSMEQLPLVARPVAVFYKEYLAMLASFATVELDPLPVEISKPIRFDLDHDHRSYDSEAVGRFWNCLIIADTLFKRFSTRFYGKISPVHFFWGSFDLAVTRFNGKRAPVKAQADPVQAEAYSHEVISAGFWPGNGGYGRAAFYAYAAPVPEGLAARPVTAPGRFDPGLGEFLLDYDEVQQAANPAAMVLRFLEKLTLLRRTRLAGTGRRLIARTSPCCLTFQLETSYPLPSLAPSRLKITLARVDWVVERLYGAVLKWPTSSIDRSACGGCHRPRLIMVVSPT